MYHAKWDKSRDYEKFCDGCGIVEGVRDVEIKTVRPRGTDSAKVISVIVTESVRGYGIEDDLCRTVTQYWDFDGTLLAENDPVGVDNARR